MRVLTVVDVIEWIVERDILWSRLLVGRRVVIVEVAIEVNTWGVVRCDAIVWRGDVRVRIEDTVIWNEYDFAWRDGFSDNRLC